MLEPQTPYERMALNEFPQAECVRVFNGSFVVRAPGRPFITSGTTPREAWESAVLAAGRIQYAREAAERKAAA